MANGRRATRLLTRAPRAEPRRLRGRHRLHPRRYFSIRWLTRACLSTHARTEESFYRKCESWFLTDYYPLKLLLDQMSVLIGQDWASIAGANFLAAKGLGLTKLNLVRAVTEKNSIKEVQKMREGFISSCFAKHRLLVWNYFPFLRARSQIGRRRASK